MLIIVECMNNLVCLFIYLYTEFIIIIIIIVIITIKYIHHESSPNTKRHWWTNQEYGQGNIIVRDYL